MDKEHISAQIKALQQQIQDLRKMGAPTSYLTEKMERLKQDLDPTYIPRTHNPSYFRRKVNDE